jgi:ATP-dependent RNA helicase DDX19/DBP5
VYSASIYILNLITDRQAVCLAPLRELALLIMSLSLWANSPQSKLNTIKDNLARNSGPITAHVVAWTLGTDLMRKRFINVSDIKVFVLDEADNMLDQDGLGHQTLRVKK